MSFRELESTICRLGTAQFFTLIAEVCEDKVTDYVNAVDAHIKKYMLHVEYFDEKTAQELEEEYGSDAKELIESCRNYSIFIKSIPAGKQVIKILRSINPCLKGEDVFKSEQEKERLILHRDKYEAYYQIDSIISQVGINDFFQFIIDFFSHRLEESEFFYFDCGISGEWQEYQEIVTKLSYISYHHIPPNLFKNDI